MVSEERNESGKLRDKTRDKIIDDIRERAIEEKEKNSGVEHLDSHGQPGEREREREKEVRNVE